MGEIIQDKKVKNRQVALTRDNQIDKDIEKVLNQMLQRTLLYLREIDILFDCVHCVVQAYLARPHLKDLAYTMLMDRMHSVGFGNINNRGGS